MAFRALRLAAVGVAIVALGCSPSVPAGVSDDTWVGTVTTEGGVTTVVNESGSVWGGRARLVEESSIAGVRRREPGWTWDGAGMPDHLPAYDAFYATAAGDVWVLRNAPGVRSADCVEDPLDQDAWESASSGQRRCWRNAYVVDAFDPEGRFLGEVETPPGAFEYPYSFANHIRGDRVVATVEDDAGVVRVKRYRLALPGEQ